MFQHAEMQLHAILKLLYCLDFHFMFCFIIWKSSICCWHWAWLLFLYFVYLTLKLLYVCTRFFRHLTKWNQMFHLELWIRTLVLKLPADYQRSQLTTHGPTQEQMVTVDPHMNHHTEMLKLKDYFIQRRCHFLTTQHDGGQKLSDMVWGIQILSKPETVRLIIWK